MRLIKKMKVEHSKKHIRLLVDLGNPKEEALRNEITKMISDFLKAVWHLNRISKTKVGES